MPDLWAVFGIAGLSIAYSANRAAPYNSGMVVRRPPHQNIAKQADRPDRASVVLCRRLSFGALLAVLLMLPPPSAQSQTMEKPHDTSAPTDEAAAGAFKSCIAEIAPDALRRVSQKTFDAATSGLEADPQILDQLQSQPEFNQPIWQYLDAIVNEDRIAAGRVVLLGLRPLFSAVEEAFGADRFIIAAIWGVESNFGTDAGSYPVIRATATLACMGRRQAYFRNEFIAALEILERGDVAPDRFKGSWSGAFGGTQFMPTTFLRFAVDFDGNGRRDIIDDVPDILASTANVLRAYGWTRGKPCAVEVTLPPGFDYSLTSERKPIAEWTHLGVVPSSEARPLDQRDEANLWLPAGHEGPAFLLSNNFEAIKKYNTAEAYALAVCQLADRLRGGGPLSKPWPRDERVLSAAERLELQSLLKSQGFDVGPIDGMMGIQTRAAIRQFQTKSNLVPDGFPSAMLLERLRHP